MSDTTPIAQRQPVPQRHRVAIVAIAGALALAAGWAGAVVAQVSASDMDVAINDGTSNT